MSEAGNQIPAPCLQTVVSTGLQACWQRSHIQMFQGHPASIILFMWAPLPRVCVHSAALPDIYNKTSEGRILGGF